MLSYILKFSTALTVKKAHNLKLPFNYKSTFLYFNSRHPIVFQYSQ